MNQDHIPRGEINALVTVLLLVVFAFLLYMGLVIAWALLATTAVTLWNLPIWLIVLLVVALVVIRSERFLTFLNALLEWVLTGGSTSTPGNEPPARSPFRIVFGFLLRSAIIYLPIVIGLRELVLYLHRNPLWTGGWF